MLSLNDVATNDAKRPLHDLCARFEAGKIYTILGRTGAGKTELLRALIGLDPISGGQILLDGQDLARRPIRARDMAMVYQQFINYPHLSVLDNVTFPLRRHGIAKAPAQARARAALQLVGLETFADRRPSALSGGQQQRVALARAIVKEARILLLDEPLANLDYKLRETLREEFPRLMHSNRDSTILYATTEPAEAVQLGDEMIVMDQGRIVASGRPETLFDHPPSVAVARVISDPAITICAGRVARGEVLFETGAPTGLRSTLPDQPVQIGLRPDALCPGDRFPARVSLAEFSGSDTILYLDLGFTEAVMLLDGVHGFDPDQQISVDLIPGKLLLFAPDGRALTGGPKDG